MHQLYGGCYYDGENGHLRQKGKVAELACGYGGGKNALIAMGALDGGIAESELPTIVRQWREASPNIVRFWSRVEKASRYTISTGRTARLQDHFLTFALKGNWLDVAFTVALMAYMVKYIVYGFQESDWNGLYVAMAGVILWPNKKYVQKGFYYFGNFQMK